MKVTPLATNPTTGMSARMTTRVRTETELSPWPYGLSGKASRCTNGSENALRLKRMMPFAADGAGCALALRR
jgi:hypothetical protein